MLLDRVRAKRAGDFNTADDLRDELLEARARSSARPSASSGRTAHRAFCRCWSWLCRIGVPPLAGDAASGGGIVTDGRLSVTRRSVVIPDDRRV